MLKLNRQTRVALATLVAVAQVLVVTHGTLIAHTLSASGALVERATNANAEHDHDSASWCREDVHRHAMLDGLCHVAKTTQASRLGLRGAEIAERGVERLLSTQLPRAGYRPLGELVVSPKASPPGLV